LTIRDIILRIIPPPRKAVSRSAWWLPITSMAVFLAICFTLDFTNKLIFTPVGVLVNTAIPVVLVDDRSRSFRHFRCAIGLGLQLPLGPALSDHCRIGAAAQRSQ
jgi:hypothetical protein